MSKEFTGEVVIKKRPKIPKNAPLPYTCKVELENGTKANFTLCPTRFLAKSRQYKLDDKNVDKKTT